ncbi:MAG: hypothetical protein WAV53_15540 [Anaerolineae bacterium]
MSLIPPSSVSLSCQFAPELFDYPGRAFIAFIAFIIAMRCEDLMHGLWRSCEEGVRTISASKAGRRAKWG